MGLLDLFKKAVFTRSSVSTQSELVIKRDWDKINQLILLGKPSNLREALITADRSLDTALKDMVSGDTMGERLKNAKNRFDPIMYNRIWEAHKLRNSLVHESGFEPPHFVVKEAIDNLKSALFSAGVRI